MVVPNFFLHPCLCSVEQSHLAKAAQKGQEGTGLFLMGVSKHLEEERAWEGCVWAKEANQPLEAQGVAWSRAV